MRLRILLALVTALALASCGIDTESSADVVDDERVPFGLLEADREPVTGPDPNGEVLVEIYLYDEENDVLVPVRRRLGSSSLDAVLGALERAPIDRDPDALRSALSEIDAVAGTDTSRGVATIDLTEEFSDITGADQLLAIAQLVYTATGRPGVGQVAFTLEGQTIEIPRGDGSLTSESVTRGDYARLEPPG